MHRPRRAGNTAGGPWSAQAGAVRRQRLIRHGRRRCEAARRRVRPVRGRCGDHGRTPAAKRWHRNRPQLGLAGRREGLAAFDFGDRTVVFLAADRRRPAGAMSSSGYGSNCSALYALVAGRAGALRVAASACLRQPASASARSAAQAEPEDLRDDDLIVELGSRIIGRTRTTTKASRPGNREMARRESRPPSSTADTCRAAPPCPAA